MMSNKDKSVQVLTKGVEFLFKKNKVKYIKEKEFYFQKMMLSFMKIAIKPHIKQKILY